MPTRPRKKAKAGYMISAVAELYHLHPQTLRLYERLGLLKPSRSQGNTRLYTDGDLERLEVILNLTRELGVNLAGIARILDLETRNSALESHNAQLKSDNAELKATQRKARGSASDQTRR